jgi:hypothetical protein
MIIYDPRTGVEEIPVDTAASENNSHLVLSCMHIVLYSTWQQQQMFALKSSDDTVEVYNLETHTKWKFRSADTSSTS